MDDVQPRLNLLPIHFSSVLMGLKNPIAEVGGTGRAIKFPLNRPQPSIKGVAVQGRGINSIIPHPTEIQDPLLPIRLKDKGNRTGDDWLAVGDGRDALCGQLAILQVATKQG
jgi:hypothetical protein